MAHKKVKSVSNRTEMYQFKVGWIYFMTLKQNEDFKDQVEICLSSQFETKTSQQMRKC